MGVKKDNIYNNIYLVILSALAFFIPLSQNIVVYIIALLLIVWLSEKLWYFIPVLVYVAIVWNTGSAIYIATGMIITIALVDLVLWILKKQKYSIFAIFKEKPNRQYVLYFSFLYLMYIWGLLYTSNFEYAAFDLEVKFSLLIFPMTLSTLRPEVLKSQNIRLILILFVTGALISTFISFGDAFIQYSTHLSFKEFYYRWLAYYHHPAYLAMFMNMAIIILSRFLLKNESISKKPGYIISFVALIAYFSVFIVLLSSKAGILSLLITYLLTIGYIIVIKKRFLLGVSLTIIIAAIFYLSLSVFTYSFERIAGYQQTVETSLSTEINEREETGDRITIWTNALSVVEENILFGVGTGDAKDFLLESYKKTNSIEAYEDELNAHNQYLQTFISLGMIGFLVLLLSFILPAYYSLKKDSFIYILFLIIVSVNFLTESMLETQAGVVFYAFFNSFLLLMLLDNNKPANRKNPIKKGIF